ncbi:MAG: hypothetical protein RLZZ200_680 [Pseudomonadota bacterium]
MVTPTATPLAINTSLVLDGVAYELDSKQPHKVETIDTQPGEADREFEQRVVNLANGWGASKYVRDGDYDYAVSAVLHRRMAFRPGAAVTDRTNATPPIGDVSFCEYWDGAAGNRRLIIVSPRHVYEVKPDGTVTVNDLGASFTVERGMTKGIRFKDAALAAPKVFIARPSTTLTDYFVTRNAENNYAVTASNKYAAALGVAKDSTGADVIWRITEAGKLNQLTGEGNPESAGAWANATYDVGEVSAQVNDLVQQGKAMLVGRTDGAWTFDNVTNSIPVTVGMMQTPGALAFRYFKDWNGQAIAPTPQGIIWIDGLNWGTCGPVSSNPNARNLRYAECAVSHGAGNYLYAAAYDGVGTSYVWMGTARAGGQSGVGPFVWHGPIASVPYRISDLWVSTVTGSPRLWIGGDKKWGTIELNADFSPKSDLSTGYIYLPDGILDMSGPGVIKDLRKAEFIAPGDTPFAATNSWTLEINVASAGYVAIDGGAVSAGRYAERYWTTETYFQRCAGVRLKWAGNTGAAELETVVIRGTERPEKSDLHTFRIVASDGQRLPTGVRNVRMLAKTVEATLRALVDSGRKVASVYDGQAFTCQVKSWKEVTERTGRGPTPRRTFEITARRIKLA